MRALEVVSPSKWRVIALSDSRGECELAVFLGQQDGRFEKDGDRIMALLASVAGNGPPRNTDVSHQIDGPIWEFIKGRLRVLWFYDDNRLVVCSHGFVKRSQKTPKAEIDKAHRAHADYQKAKSLGTLEIEEFDDDQ